MTMLSIKSKHKQHFIYSFGATEAMMRPILSLALIFPPLVLNTFYGEQKYDNIL